MTTESLIAQPIPSTVPTVAAGARRWTDRARTVVRGREADPVWVRPALLGLLLATAVLYLWGLGASGWANSFYSAAVQAGSASWKAMFFGSSDAANSITVDKPPASLWVMELSVRMFGLSSWSILVPQALEGVAAVGVLYLAVRRTSGAAGGLIAGAVLAATPVAALMFRFNNPDALLVLLMTIAAYATVRALQTASTRWLVTVGVLIGFGFLTKQLQALLVVPGFALAYVICAPTGLRRRIVQLLLAGAAMIGAAGWWIAIVQLTPAKYRPYIGGSQHNSILELTFGYNGFGRLTGNETGSVGGGGPTGGNGGGMWGAIGWNRLFGTQMGGEIAWLLPTALVTLALGLWFSRRAPRTNQVRAALIVWGGWLVVTALTFSFAKGIIHPYYTVALAPAIGGIIGVTTAGLWRIRHDFGANIALALTVALTAAWQFTLLDRVSGWQPWLRFTVLIVGLLAALLLIGLARLTTRLAAGVAGLALLGTLAAPVGYSIATAATPHTGSIPSSGPAGFTTSFGPGGRGIGRARGFGRFNGGAGTPTFGGGFAGGFPGGLPGGLPGGIANGTAGRFGGGGAGGLLDSSKPSAAVVAALKADASKYTWVAAAVGSNSAAGFQLASQEPVMPIGGFNGSDPSPTLAQFKAYVAAGKIHYFIASGGFGGQRGGSQAASEITGWVASNFTATTVGGATLYDLSK